MKLLILLLSLLGNVLLQHLPLTHVVSENSYISKAQPNHNFGNATELLVTNGLLLWEKRAILQFNLDGTIAFFDMKNYEVGKDFIMDDCNWWRNIAVGNLTVEITESLCPLGHCTLSLYTVTTGFCESGVTWNCPFDSNKNNDLPDCAAEWTGGCLQESNKIYQISISNGQTGIVSFDITTVLENVVKPHFNRSFAITVDFGSVSIASNNAVNSSAPQIIVTNPDPVVDEQCTRLYTTVMGFNISYLLCTPNGGPFVTGVNPVLINHGQPEYSYLWSYFGQLISNNLNTNVFILDMLGSGRSTHVLDLSEWNYSLSNQSLVIDGFATAVNITQGGTVKIDHIVFEEGTLPGIYFDANNPDSIASITFFLNGYVQTCPWEYSTEENNPPPSSTTFGDGGTGLCQNETLVPLSYWQYWEECVYPSYACTCKIFGYWKDPTGQLSFFPPGYLPPSGVITNNLAPYVPLSEDPICATDRMMIYPQLVNVPVAGVPADSILVNATINAFMKNTTLPKLFLYSDEPTSTNHNRVQVARAMDFYQNIKSRCYGAQGAHLDHYTFSMNLAQIYTDFIQGL